VRFSREVAELDNQLVHLTNVAVQKEGSSYNSSHGHKWPLQDLRLHLEATRGHGPTAQLFEGIESLVLHTLKAVQPVGVALHDGMAAKLCWTAGQSTVCQQHTACLSAMWRAL
jgi:hypothetical protein